MSQCSLWQVLFNHRGIGGNTGVAEARHILNANNIVEVCHKYLKYEWSTHQTIDKCNVMAGCSVLNVSGAEKGH